MARLSAVFVLLLVAGCEAPNEFIDACQKRANLRLSAPSTAKYGPLSEVAGIGPDDGYVETESAMAWMGYVDSETPLGGTQRTYVVCIQQGTEPIEVTMSSHLEPAILDVW